MKKKHKNKKGLFVFCVSFSCILVTMLLTPLTLAGQEKASSRIITGIVLDNQGLELPGVSVIVSGTQTATITDADGRYRISVPSGRKSLTFKYIGFAEEVIDISDKQIVNVTMQELSSALDEVIIVGYGVQKKESSVAAISQVKGDDLVKASTTSLANALAGQIPGISTVQSSGQPGADASKIYIRGVSSWVGNDPLVMVDGVERSFNDIDPNEVESISVLKDASATAVFGVRGANGVILITTKRGTKGEIKVNATLEFTMKQPIGMIAPENSYITGLVMNEAFKNDNNWGSILSNEVLEHYRIQDMPYLYPNTNWQEEMIKDVAFSQKYNVNIAGGTEYARVFASVSYTNEGDIIKTKKQPTYDPRFKYNRYNYRFNIDTDITRTTLLSLDAGGYIGIRNSPYETNIQRLYRPIFMLGPMDIPPYYPAEALNMYPDNRRPEEVGDRLASTGLPNSENPNIANNYSGSRQLKTTDLNVTLKLSQKLDFITEGLSFTGKAAYNNNTTYSKAYSYDAVSYKLNADLAWARYRGRDGKLDGESPQSPVTSESEGIYADKLPFRSWYFEAALNYAQKFGKHDITALFLGQRRKTQTNIQFPTYEQGVTGRVTYDFNNRYLFEANLAYNGSEQFAPHKRYGLFPSFAIGWNLHHEKFFKPVSSIVSRAKIRASYGEVGSDNSSSRWLYVSSYVNGNTGNKFRPGTAGETGPTITSVIEENAANIDATWERAIKKDIGIEMAFLPNNMFTLTLDFYKENRDQILLDRMSVPAWFGVGMKQQNLGKTETKGYEMELKFQHELSSGFHYWLKPGISFSDNRIIERDEPMYKPEYQKQAGNRIFQQMGYVSVGMIQNADQQMNSLRYGSGIMGLGDSQWVDFNGDGKIDEQDQVPMGYSTLYPLYNYSLSGGFQYKNFEFDFLFQGVSHVSKVVIDAYSWPLHRLSNHVFDYQRDAWSPDNRNAQYNAYHFDANRTHNNIGDGAVRSTNLYDGSYIRLKTVNIGYSIPKKVVKSMGIDNMKIFLRGNNIFTWAPHYPLADPEASDGGSAARLVYGYYPMLRRILIGAQLTF